MSCLPRILLPIVVYTTAPLIGTTRGFSGCVRLAQRLCVGRSIYHRITAGPSLRWRLLHGRTCALFVFGLQTLMRGSARRLAAILFLGATTSCARYHTLPLPNRADLTPSLAQLHRDLPGDDKSAGRRIAVDRPLDLDAIGLLAVLNDPDLRSEHGQLGVAQAQLLETSLLPNPTANLAYGALLGGPGTSPSYAASLSEDVAALVTYHARRRSAEAHLAEVNAGQLWQEWQVAEKARLIAFDLYWGIRANEEQRRAFDLLDATLGDVRAATSAGNLDLAALSPLEAARATAEEALASQELEQLKNWQALDGLLGLSPDIRFDLAPPSLPALPNNLAALAARLPEQRPDLIALQLGYRSADQDLRAAILGQFPAFTLGGSWNSDTTGVRSAGPTVTFDLPIFNRNQGRIAAASATRLLLREEYQARLDSAVAGINGLLAQQQKLEMTLRGARQAAATAAALARAAQSAYTQGNIDQRAWTDFQTTSLERRLAVIALEKSLGEAEITLTVELGIGLPRARIVPDDTAEKL